ncbi:hypothetical protein ATANTOWER_029543, partial [Ataeniobius toweri]|nr:hypothetical protein [Ataeniobius toweri]
LQRLQPSPACPLSKPPCSNHKPPSASLFPELILKSKPLTKTTALTGCHQDLDFSPKSSTVDSSMLLKHITEVCSTICWLK